ncbi:MAG TPA: hypothetical protein DCE26_00650, partial [Dehalococcoidia bacterium]|nr:hypothetical protein [Dehalococcoidia bacterium]
MNPATNSGKGTLSINMDLLAPSAEEEAELKDQQEEPPVKEPEFLPCQLVRIKQAAELEAPDIPFPAEHVQGMAGGVEMAGKVYVYSETKEAMFVQAYFVRVDGVGPVLTGENWLEDNYSLSPRPLNRRSASPTPTFFVPLQYPCSRSTVIPDERSLG